MATLVADNVAIDPRAEIGENVEIGPFCVIGPHARIGSGTRLENNVTLMGRVTIGRHNHIFPGTVIGGAPQDVSYHGTDTEVFIGDHNIIREGRYHQSGVGEGRRRYLDRQPQFPHGLLPHRPRLAAWGNHIIITNRHASGRARARLRPCLDLRRRGRAPLCHHRHLQLRGRLERRAARRAALHAGRGLPRPTPLQSTSWRSNETASPPRSSIAWPRLIGSSNRAKVGFGSRPGNTPRKPATRSPGESPAELRSEPAGKDGTVAVGNAGGPREEPADSSHRSRSTGRIPCPGSWQA